MSTFQISSNLKTEQSTMSHINMTDNPLGNVVNTYDT